MQIPYIYTTPMVTVQQEVNFDNEHGVIYKPVKGEHAIWAARVPFLPTMLSEDFTRLGKQRIVLIMQRQIRFIYDLARAREHRATFELRFIALPNPVPGQPNLIEIVFLGKAFSQRERGAQVLAEQLWDKFISNFPLEEPFNYPIEPVTQEAEFHQYYEPLPFDELGREQILEIRKYEDMPVSSAAPLGRRPRVGDYVAHPFVPNTDFNPMGRFLAALAQQPQKCYIGISLRPTRMWDQEIQNVGFAIGQFRRTVAEDDSVPEEYIRSFSRVGAYVYQQLMQEHEQLVMVRVYLVGESTAPRGLAEALGSELMGNAENKYPTQWSLLQPADDDKTQGEMAKALNNLRYLEHDFWGATRAAPPLERLRYLATAMEAYGAFRLPVPPESGYMPGILVKSEPFVAPADELEMRRRARANLNAVRQEPVYQAQEKKVDLGTVYHRGNVTPQSFSINVRDLTRHALIAGSTGSGKSTTIKHLLVQLWLQHRIPFLVLYPVDKPDYRELRGLPELAQDLLIFTLGDESTSPFRFNPFEVPDGLLLKTHLSRLMRVFVAALGLWDPLPMIYREALRRVYRAKGWNTVLERGETGRNYPVMSEFYTTIKQITEELQYGGEVKDNVRQASVIRIADLLENAGHVVNVRRSMPLVTILNQPTVMELGRVGSPQDTALLMGFLLVRFAEEVECHPRPPDMPHITVVEEAHRLMAESSVNLGQSGDVRSAASEDFSNILAEVRGYGEGIVIAEQIPTLLVKGAIGNTYIKIMHWLEDAPSFELFSSVMNLNMQQREYARTLTPGYAVVRNPYGRPVHIKVPEFGHQDGCDRQATVDNGDQELNRYMTEQRQKLHLEDVPVVEWEAYLQAVPQAPLLENARQIAQKLLRAPLRTCAFCKPLLEEGKCLHRESVRKLRETPKMARLSEELREIANLDNHKRWDRLNELGHGVEQRDIFYCLLAHVMNDQWEQIPQELKYPYRRILRQFESYYQAE